MNEDYKQLIKLPGITGQLTRERERGNKCVGWDSHERERHGRGVRWGEQRGGASELGTLRARDT